MCEILRASMHGIVCLFKSEAQQWDISRLPRLGEAFFISCVLNMIIDKPGIPYAFLGTAPYIPYVALYCPPKQLKRERCFLSEHFQSQ